MTPITGHTLDKYLPDEKRLVFLAALVREARRWWSRT
jgi:hypothetical protein